MSFKCNISNCYISVTIPAYSGVREQGGLRRRFVAASASAHPDCANVHQGIKMTHFKVSKLTLLTVVSSLALAACSDSTSEIVSPGDQGGNPGTGNPPPPPTTPPTTPPPPTSPCPTGTVETDVMGQTHCQLSGTITDDLTLTAGNIYQLAGAVFVGQDVGRDGAATTGDPAVLTIEPGVTIYGRDTDSILVVSRGSQIDADGDQNNPIIFTSAEDIGVAAEFNRTQRAQHTGAALDDPNTGEWGGLIINGRAPINVCNQAEICEAEGEGSSGSYGGDQPDDNSGTLRYVQVRYAGFEITPENELNGIAFQGVGAGTTVDFIQVHNNADDGVEFFGGTVNAKHVLITGADDDSVDWTQGWSGNLQFVLVLQNENQGGTNNGFEGDNLEANDDFLPRSTPTIANLTLIGASTGDAGMLIREGSAGQYLNAVVTDFPDACLVLDDDSTINQLNPANASDPAAALRFQSVLFGCDTAYDDGGALSQPFDFDAFFANGTNTIVGDTSLSGFVNGPAEAGVSVVDVAAIDPFFDAVDFIGAVPNANAPTANEEGNWTLGWTFGVNPDPECPSVTGVTPTNGGCILEGTLTGTVRLPAGLDYFIRDAVFVGEDVGGDAANPNANAATGELIIDAGARLIGESTDSILVVSRGSQIFSNGTRQAPVVFTATNPETRDVNTASGEWGGLIINGRAPINTCNEAPPFCEAEGEGSSGTYGGNDPDDDSGQLFFTRVEFAGFEITPENELNGIAFQGVGRGTDIDFIQVHNNDDDGIEFFGGTVNAKHVLITGADDDSVDWTQGWSGRLQYVLVVQNPDQGGTNNGYEGDNLEANDDFLPRSTPAIANATLIGATTGDAGMLIREGSAGQYLNTVVAGFPDACLVFDDDSTVNQLNPANASDVNVALRFESVLLGCATAYDDGSALSQPFDFDTYFAGGTNTMAGMTSLQAPANGSFAYINGDNEAAVPSVTLQSLSSIDPFFDDVDFIGAVESAEENWTTGWTIWLNQ